MFDIFKIKTQLEVQLDEYVDFKFKSSPFIAGDQREILRGFICSVKHKTITEITIEEIEAYHTELKYTTTPFTTIKSMQAIRAFLRFHKHVTDIPADTITNQGMDSLQNVGKKVSTAPVVRAKRGRPCNVELVKKVKRLRDLEHLSFRAISKALNKDVKNVYLMYKYDI